MPYVTERWPGGMLTNFPTIRKAVKKMSTIDKMASDGTFNNMSKREKLQISRQRAKLEKNLGSIADMARLPAALFVIDIMKEHIAVSEARRLNLPIFGIVDTNSDPELVDFPIPANDDATNSIAIVLDTVIEAIREGNNERKSEKDIQDENDSQNRKPKKSSRERNRMGEDDGTENKRSGKRLTRKMKNVEEEKK
jgi:small subunit ribosomal protein S2